MVLRSPSEKAEHGEKDVLIQYGGVALGNGRPIAMYGFAHALVAQGYASACSGLRSTSSSQHYRCGH